jgi:predicted amidohydrolase YtcJ
MNEGLAVGISTDFNVSPAEDATPISILQTVINGGGKHEHDAITAKQFLRGITEYSGYVSGKNDVGTLMPGKKADMTIFDKDFLQMTKEEINKNPPKIVETVISGRITDIASIDTHEFKGRSRKIKSPRKSC